MNKNVTVNVEGMNVLNHVDAFFDGSSKGILLEIFQNARRAGATRIDVNLHDEYKSIRIANNGAPVDDFQNLFSLGGSSEYSEEIQNEDPAGMGFFISSLYAKTTITTRKEDKCYQVEVTKEQLKTQGSNINVESIPYEDALAPFAIFLEDGPEITEEDVEKVAYLFDVPVYMHGDLQPQLDKSKLDYKGTHNGFNLYTYTDWRLLQNQDLYYRSVSSNTCLNYHGHLIDLQTHLRSMLNGEANSYIYIEPTQDCKIRLVLPSRIDIVQDEVSNQLLMDIIKVILIPKYSEGHYLPYIMYKTLKKIDPSFPEATVPDCLYNTKDTLVCKNLEEDTAWMLEYNDIKFVQYDMVHNAGYSWYPKDVITDADFTYSDPLWGEDQYDSDEIYRNGRLKRNEEGFSDISLFVRGKFIAKLDALILSDSYYGYFVEDCDVWLAKPADKDNNKITDIVSTFVDSVLDNLWQEDYEGEINITDQRDENERNLTQMLMERLVSKEVALLGKSEEVVKKYQWDFDLPVDNRTMIFPAQGNVISATINKFQSSVILPQVKIKDKETFYSFKEFIDKIDGDVQDKDELVSAFISMCCSQRMTYDSERDIIVQGY